MKLTIVCYGGVIQEVSASEPCEVIIIDRDDLENAGKDDSEIEEIISNHTQSINVDFKGINV